MKAARLGDQADSLAELLHTGIGHPGGNFLPVAWWMISKHGEQTSRLLVFCRHASYRCLPAKCGVMGSRPG